jgi:cysteine-rich repeat protein
MTIRQHPARLGLASALVLAVAATGCLQAASAVCEGGGACPEGLRCGIRGTTQVCVSPTCGNGRPDLGEACDDGNNVSGDGCPADCSAPCGDGIVDPGEACDDGNSIDGDGCDSNCTVTACGNGIVDPGEMCDDGNQLDGDGCDSNCTVAACGNGIVDPGEMCDDGNQLDADGCERDCTWTCFRADPTVVISPSMPPAIPPGTTASIDIAITDHDGAHCPSSSFGMQAAFGFQGRIGGLVLGPFPFHMVPDRPLMGGETGHFTLTATAAGDLDPGTRYTVHVLVDGPQFFGGGTLEFTIGPLIACRVLPARELLISDVSVVDDPIRTVFDPMVSDPRNGVWTFKHLIENAAPTDADAPAMVEAMLTSFTAPQTINGFPVAARPDAHFVTTDSWPRTPDGALDLAQAPVTLQAIVYRFDLRDPAGGDAGEVRFVFALHEPSGPNPLHATLMLAYKLPAATVADVLGWAQAFHGLGALVFDEPYSAALQAVTERFVARGAAPGRRNGSALAMVQTNERDFGIDGSWEMRQFELSPATGLLVPVALPLTPDRSFDQTAALAGYLDANQAAILGDRQIVPDLLGGHPFRAGAILNEFRAWTAPGADGEVRHHFAVDTCNGCHSALETGTSFVHIAPRAPHSAAVLSGFLTGTTVPDPVTSRPRSYADLARRTADFASVVCAGASPLAAQGSGGGPAW